MNPYIATLVESVRRLALEKTPTQENPFGIRMNLTKPEIPVRLYDVADALEAVDKNGALSDKEDIKLRVAIDQIFRWMQSQNIDIREPVMIVRDILGKKEKPKEYRMKPKPKPNRVIGTPVRLDVNNFRFKGGDYDKVNALAHELNSVRNHMGNGMR